MKFGYWFYFDRLAAEIAKNIPTSIPQSVTRGDSNDTQ
jgi:hypothetical protein